MSFQIAPLLLPWPSARQRVSSSSRGSPRKRISIPTTSCPACAAIFFQSRSLPRSTDGVRACGSAHTQRSRVRAAAGSGYRVRRRVTATVNRAARRPRSNNILLTGEPRVCRESNLDWYTVAHEASWMAGRGGLPSKPHSGCFAGARCRDALVWIGCVEAIPARRELGKGGLRPDPRRRCFEKCAILNRLSLSPGRTLQVNSESAK